MYFKLLFTSNTYRNAKDSMPIELVLIIMKYIILHVRFLCMLHNNKVSYFYVCSEMVFLYHLPVLNKRHKTSKK